MKSNSTAGYLASLLTVIMWGTTFISTKILLVDFQPVEILFFRFIMGLLALLLAYPRRLIGTNRRQELTFATAGLCGVCLYYLLENIALTYTMASNVGVIISAAPFFMAILCHLFLKEEKPHASFFIFMLPMLLLFDFKWELTRLTNPVYLFNILFLGLGASALCFVTWNFAVKALGSVKTSVYLYMVPVITVITSSVVLHEKITALAAVGTVLTLMGLLLSECRALFRKQAL